MGLDTPLQAYSTSGGAEPRLSGRIARISAESDRSALLLRGGPAHRAAQGLDHVVRRRAALVVVSDHHEHGQVEPRELLDGERGLRLVEPRGLRDDNLPVLTPVGRQLGVGVAEEFRRNDRD